MQFTKEKIVERKLSALQAASYSGAMEIPVWQTRTGMFQSDGTYADVSPEWTEISVGEHWICKDYLTRWFRQSIAVPDAFAGKPLALEIETGGEGIVRVNGAIACSITSYLVPREATRTRVWLSDSAVAGAQYEVEIEAHLLYAEFCGFREQGYQSIEYTFRSAQLVAIDAAVQDYYFDVLNAFECMKALESPADRVVRCQTRLPDEIVRFFERVGSDSFLHDKLAEAITASLTLVDFDFDVETLRKSVPAAARKLREALSALPQTAHAVVKMVGQAHIDTAWLWPLAESIRKSAQTLANVCDLMDRYPEFTFAFSQPQLFAFVKVHYPQLFERVREKVKSGQFELVGNTWVEMDTNVPSGESLIRQILYGRQFFLKEFGRASDVFWMPDVFGYTWALPQIIKRSGMKYFYTSKLIGNDDNRFPYSLFLWQGADGTRVPAYLQRLNYNGFLGAEALSSIYQRFDQKTVLDEAFMTFGFGDGGGGPTYQMLERGRRLTNFPGIPRLQLTTAADFFQDAQAVEDKLPVWNDEMYYEFHRGTYTSQANNKKNNRLCELLYRRAEIASVFANDACHLAYPYETLLQGYQHLLTNQFHDILPGSSIHQVYEDCAKDYAWIQNNGTAILNTALAALEAQIPHGEGDILVWNFLSWPRSQCVSVCLKDTPLSSASAVTAFNAAGKAMKSSFAPASGVLTFLAEDVPAMGYALFSLRACAPEASPSVSVSQSGLENRFYKIRLDENGHFVSLYDKRCGREVLAGPSNRLVIFEDKPAAESAWNIDLEYQNKRWDLDGVEEIRVVEQTPLRGVLRVCRSFHRSRIEQDIILYGDSDRIDFRTRVSWQETEKMLKTEFLVDVLSSRATYEIPFAAIERTTHNNTSFDRTKFEVPAHRWADLSEGRYGVSLLNDCKYGYDIKGQCMRLTLLRAPVFPDPTGDKGEHEFTYSLLPHAGNWITANTVRAGYELNVPLLAQRCAASQAVGSLPAAKSFARSLQDNVIIDTVKRAEDGSGIVLRLYESSGSKTEAALEFSFPAEGVWECNLMEEEERRMPLCGNRLAFSIRPFEIKTFKLACRDKN